MNENRKHQRHSLEGMGIYAQTFVSKDVEILDISMSGASLKGSKRFDIGRQYSFRFTHKGHVVSLKGRIEWEKLSGIQRIGEDETIPIYMAGISFGEVPADTSSQLSEFIMDNDKLLRERRIGGIRVKVHAEKGILSSLEAFTIKDISIGGVRIETEHEPSLNEVFNFELMLEENEEPIGCKGRILYYHETEGTTGGYSAGVEFINVEDKPRLERFVDTLPKNEKITDEGLD